MRKPWGKPKVPGHDKTNQGALTFLFSLGPGFAAELCPSTIHVVQQFAAAVASLITDIHKCSGPTVPMGISETTQLQMEEGNLRQDKELLGLESIKAITPAVKTIAAYCSCLWLLK